MRFSWAEMENARRDELVNKLVMYAYLVHGPSLGRAWEIGILEDALDIFIHCIM